jgi:hypothetical protein
MRRAQSGAIFDDGAGLAGGVFTDAPAKTVISGRCMLAGGETGPFRRRWEHRGPRRGKTLQRKASDVANQLELKGQKEIPYECGSTTDER